MPSSKPVRLSVIPSDKPAPPDDRWVDLLAQVCISARENRARKEAEAKEKADRPQSEPDG